MTATPAPAFAPGIAAASPSVEIESADGLPFATALPAEATVELAIATATDGRLAPEADLSELSSKAGAGDAELVQRAAAPTGSGVALPLWQLEAALGVAAVAMLALWLVLRRRQAR
jgi:hypothetical protein